MRLFAIAVLLVAARTAYADAELAGARWSITARAATGAMPWGVAVSDDGSVVYVTHVGERDRDNVRRYNATTLGVTARARFRGHAVESALTAAGDTLYVTNSRRHRILALDPTTLATKAVLATGEVPKDFRIAPDGGRLYVADYGGHTLSVVDLSSGSRTSVRVGRHPRGIAVAPDGAVVYVVNMGAGTISVVDARTLAVTATWRACRGARHAQVVGARLLVTCFGGRHVVVLDAATGAELRRIAVGRGPKTIAVSRDSTLAITADERSNTATLIELATYRTASLRLGAHQPCGAVFAPDGRRVYITARGSDELLVVTAQRMRPHASSSPISQNESF